MIFLITFIIKNDNIIKVKIFFLNLKVLLKLSVFLKKKKLKFRFFFIYKKINLKYFMGILLVPHVSLSLLQYDAVSSFFEQRREASSKKTFLELPIFFTIRN